MWTRRVVVALVLPAAWLVVPQAAQAAFAPSVSGQTGVLTGTAAGESVTISTAGGLLSHNIPPSGNLNSQFDWDAVTPGDQTLGIGSATLVVNAGDGDDQIVVEPAAAPVAVVLNGDSGNDTITGGGAAETISGGAGDDLIVGRTGADTMTGGTGDDAFVWNNGDGTDKVDGDDGSDIVEVNGSLTSGDNFVVKPNGSRVRLDRTNLGLFGIDLVAERLSVNALGGNDSMTVLPGTPTLPVLDGGGGDDTFSVRDGAPTYVFGGSGTDKATTDAPALDATNAVETVDATGAAVLAVSPHKKASKGKLVLDLSCAAAGPACTGDLQVLTKKAVRLGDVKAKAVLADGHYNVAAGSSTTVKLKLAKGYRELARHRKLALVVVARGADGGTTTTALSLKV